MGLKSSQPAFDSKTPNSGGRLLPGGLPPGLPARIRVRSPLYSGGGSSFSPPGGTATEHRGRGEAREPDVKVRNPSPPPRRGSLRSHVGRGGRSALPLRNPDLGERRSGGPSSPRLGPHRSPLHWRLWDLCKNLDVGRGVLLK